MAITPEEKKRRIESLKTEKEAIEKLNDLSDLYDRVKSEKSIAERIGIGEKDEPQKIASKAPKSTPDKTL